MGTFLSFCTLFLDCLLELVQFLAQLCKRLLCRIGFLSAFLGSAEISFFHSIFLIPMTIFCAVHGIHAPMHLAEVAMLLGASFLGDSGHRLSTRSLVSFLALVGSFLIGLYIGLFLGTYVLYNLQRGMRSKHMSTNVIPFLWRLNWSCYICGYIQRTWLARSASANGTFMGIILVLTLVLWNQQGSCTM